MDINILQNIIVCCSESYKGLEKHEAEKSEMCDSVRNDSYASHLKLLSRLATVLRIIGAPHLPLTNLFFWFKTN